MSGLCGKDCSKCVLQKDYCDGCSLCEASLCDKNCKACYALCPERPEAFPYFLSIGGPEIEVRGNEKIELSAHIPVLPDRFQEMPKYEIMPDVGIHAGNMFSRGGKKVNPGYLENGFAAALNIDERCEGLLQFYVKDRTLEGFWDYRKSIYKDLYQMNFKVVISPNFSVYEDAPRMDHLQNIKRTTAAYNELLDAGLNAVPDVSWYNKKDLDRWIREINDNKVNTIAFSFQVVDVKLKASNTWKNYITGFRYLCQNIDTGVRIILIGASSPRRLKEIHKAAAGQEISILNQSAYVQSRRGMISQGRKQNAELTKDEIFERNVRYFNDLCEGLNRQYSKCGGGPCQNQEDQTQSLQGVQDQEEDPEV